MKRKKRLPKEARRMLWAMAQHIVSGMCQSDPDCPFREMGLEKATESLLECIHAGVVIPVVTKDGTLVGVKVRNPEGQDWRTIEFMPMPPKEAK